MENKSDLTALRAAIDEIDRQLLDLFCQRMGVVAQVGLYKKAQGLPVLHPAREQEILERVRHNCPDEMGDYASDYFAQMMRISREYQQHILKGEQ